MGNLGVPRVSVLVWEMLHNKQNEGVIGKAPAKIFFMPSLSQCATLTSTGLSTGAGLTALWLRGISACSR